MKLPILIVAVLMSVGVYAQDRHVPLWEEDTHFCYYRVLQIEGQLSRMHTLLHNLDCKNADAVQKASKECQDHLDMVDMLLGNRPYDYLSNHGEGEGAEGRSIARGTEKINNLSSP